MSKARASTTDRPTGAVSSFPPRNQPDRGTVRRMAKGQQLPVPEVVVPWLARGRAQGWTAAEVPPPEGSVRAWVLRPAEWWGERYVIAWSGVTAGKSLRFWIYSPVSRGTRRVSRDYALTRIAGRALVPKP